MAPQVSSTFFTNYYDVLHLPRDATRAQIRHRFKKLSLLFHPDKNKDEDAPRIFRSLKSAEEILIDNNKKAIFDRQLKEIDEFLKGSNTRAAAAAAAKAAADRDAENRARDQRHWERDRARNHNYQNNPPEAEASTNSFPKPGNPFTERPQPKWNTPKPPRKPKPREEIYLQPLYQPTGRQPPWSTLYRPFRSDTPLPWTHAPFPIGSKNPFTTNPTTGDPIPAHGNYPLNPGNHWSSKIDAAWPIVHNEGYRVLRGCADLYRHQWRDVVAEAANRDIKADPELEEGLRRIEYMFHTFAEYIWGLLTELPRNMVLLIDADAALERLNAMLGSLQEFCNRGQRLPMAMGFLAQGVRGVLDVKDDPDQRLYDQVGRRAVLRQLREMYEAFMGEEKEKEKENDGWHDNIF